MASGAVRFRRRGESGYAAAAVRETVDEALALERGTTTLATFPSERLEADGDALAVLLVAKILAASAVHAAASVPPIFLEKQRLAVVGALGTRPSTCSHQLLEPRQRVRP